MKNTVHEVINAFYPVDTIKLSTDSTYLDSISTDQIEASGEVYGGAWRGGQWNYPTVLNDRIYFADATKSRVWYTVTGKPGLIQDAFDVSINDGDIITGLHAGENYLDIFKHNSWYRAVYNGSVHEVTLMSKGVGCVSGHSIIDLPGGGMAFMHSTGIYTYASHIQSQYKESGGMLSKISAPIQPLLDNNYTMSELKETYAWITPDKRNLCFSISGKTISYVLSLTTGEWGLWNISPRQVTYYDDTFYPASSPVPMERVYFIKYSVDSLYLFDSTNADAGAEITSVWRSGPLFVDTDYGKITGYNLWKKSNETTAFSVNLFGDGDTSIYGITDSTNYRARIIEVSPLEQYYYTFRIQSTADSLAIQRLDLWYKPKTSEAIKY